MKKKIRVVFIHGWGFNQFFWTPLVKELSKRILFIQMNFVNLGFFGSKNLEVLKYNRKDVYSIYIVHSYGYNWFVKNKIKTDLMINFCGSQNLVENSQTLNKKIIGLMIEKMKKKPETVLLKFYRNCGLENYRIEENLNKEFLIGALQNYIVDIPKEVELVGKLAGKVFSIFSKKDKILNIKNFQFLENYLKSDFKILDNENHAFPFSNPCLAADIIETCILKEFNEN